MFLTIWFPIGFEPTVKYTLFMHIWQEIWGLILWCSAIWDSTHLCKHPNSTMEQQKKVMVFWCPNSQTHMVNKNNSIPNDVNPNFFTLECIAKQTAIHFALAQFHPTHKNWWDSFKTNEGKLENCWRTFSSVLKTESEVGIKQRHWNIPASFFSIFN